jgi:hypothetical protein
MPSTTKGEAPLPRRQGNRVVLLSLALALATLWGVLAFDDSLSSQLYNGQTPVPGALALTPEPSAGTSRVPRIALWAASGSSVTFVPNNGEPLGQAPPETRVLPRLVLKRNGQLTAAGERTLLVDLAGLEVPPAGLTVSLRLDTYHGDPDRGGGAGRRIILWRESRWIPTPAGPGSGVTAVQFRHEFGAELAPGIPTPTDYLRLQVTVSEGSRAGTPPLYSLQEDFALLLENEWLVALPRMLEEAEGAAPTEFLVYYADMFPARGAGPGSGAWLRRGEVSSFVEREFVPAALEAFRLQTDGWQLPWHQAWTAHGSSRKPKQLSVALAPPDTWYHGHAPGNGHAGIAINLDAVGMGYDSLLDGMMSTFHHELFHNLQRSLYQHFGLDREGNWDMVTEGMAMVASSVAQPEVQFAQTWGRRAYLSSASAFIGEEGWSEGQLNHSYAEIAYDGSPYWRFLYEQCSTAGGREDPAAGMAILRRTMAALYARDAAQTLSPAAFVEHFAAIVDEALAGQTCPYQSHEESLVAFARALYALRLEGGRCTEAALPAGCGLYDPGDLYPRPWVDTIAYAGQPVSFGRQQQSHPAGIPSSYGIDLVEIALDPAAAGRPLTIELHGNTRGAAEFRLEIWQVREEDERLLPVTVAPAATIRRESGFLSYTLPEIDTERYTHLGLIITRVDNREDIDPRGDYTLLLRAAG